MLADSQRRKPKKSDAAVVKWILTIGKKQIGKIVFIILVNMLWASLSVVFANFSKKIVRTYQSPRLIFPSAPSNFAAMATSIAPCFKE